MRTLRSAASKRVISQMTSIFLCNGLPGITPSRQVLFWLSIQKSHCESSTSVQLAATICAHNHRLEKENALEMQAFIKIFHLSIWSCSPFVEFTCTRLYIKTLSFWLCIFHHLLPSSEDCNFLVPRGCYVKTALNKDKKTRASCMYSTNMYKIRLRLNPFFDTRDQVLSARCLSDKCVRSEDLSQNQHVRDINISLLGPIACGILLSNCNFSRNNLILGLCLQLINSDEAFMELVGDQIQSNVVQCIVHVSHSTQKTVETNNQFPLWPQPYMCVFFCVNCNFYL